MELSQHVHLLIVALGFALFSLWLASKLDFFHLPSNIEIQSLHLTEVLGAFAVFISIGVILVPAVAAVWLLIAGRSLETPLDTLTQGWLNVVVMLATAIGLFCYYKALSNRAKHAVRRQAVAKGRGQMIKDFALGVCTWLISYPAVVAIGQLVTILILFELPAHQIDQVAVKYLKMTMQYPSLFTATALLLICVVPVVEETLFRGFLQTWLRKYMGVYKAIALTSLIFAAFHFSFSQGIANIELLISLFLLSCFLGFLYERQQSLLAPYGLHIAFNAISVLMLTSLNP